jgi:hypothetical protein
MATFAVMSENYVSNIIVADTKEIAEELTNATCIEYNEINPAGIGWTHDGVNFIAPAEEETSEDPA